MPILFNADATFLFGAGLLAATALLILRQRRMATARSSAMAARTRQLSHLTIDPIEISFSRAQPFGPRNTLPAKPKQSNSRGLRKILAFRQQSQPASAAEFAAEEEQVAGRTTVLSRDAQWDRLVGFLRDCNQSAGQLSRTQTRAEEQVDVAAYAIGVLLEDLAPLMSVDALQQRRIAELRATVRSAARFEAAPAPLNTRGLTAPAAA